MRGLCSRARSCQRRGWGGPQAEVFDRRVRIHLSGGRHRRQHVRPALEEVERHVKGTGAPSSLFPGGITMKPELNYLVWSTILTGVIWIPYILDRIAVWGLPDTVGYPEAPRPQTPWARRMKSAHANAVENLVVFATLVLVANAVGISNG